MAAKETHGVLTDVQVVNGVGQHDSTSEGVHRMMMMLHDDVTGVHFVLSDGHADRHRGGLVLMPRPAEDKKTKQAMKKGLDRSPGGVVRHDTHQRSLGSGTSGRDAETGRALVALVSRVKGEQSR